MSEWILCEHKGAWTGTLCRGGGTPARGIIGCWEAVCHQCGERVTVFKKQEEKVEQKASLTGYDLGSGRDEGVTSIVLHRDHYEKLRKAARELVEVRKELAAEVALRKKMERKARMTQAVNSDLMEHRPTPVDTSNVTRDAGVEALRKQLVDALDLLRQSTASNSELIAIVEQRNQELQKAKDQAAILKSLVGLMSKLGAGAPK